MFPGLSTQMLALFSVTEETLQHVTALKAWRHVYEMSREIAVKELLVLAAS